MTFRSPGDGHLNGLLALGGASKDEIARAEEGLGALLPRDLADVMERADAAEGFVGGSYLAIWPLTALADLNRRARVSEFAPDLVFFATDGAGEGFAFARGTLSYVQVPMIGMRFIERTPLGSTFGDMLDRLAAHSPVHGAAPVVDRSRLGLIVYEINPVIVGGSPTDPANKALVSLNEYAEIVGWWNERLPSGGTFTLPDAGTAPPSTR